ncbi:hypothetical protein CA606_09230 [Caulobacter vibrioides]|uniref:Peptidase C39 domain-containing protein n=1 Tax=Caulobacter vibrioides TaxID=155892 RepID=A0A290MKC6_CAUVI|nr:hypothetical protein CA606_09230 [Caulobacter vibrioides]
MKLTPYLAQQTKGGCGPCSFIMVAGYFNPELALTEEEALRDFGVDGFGPRCFALVPSFHRAASAFGLGIRVERMDRAALRGHLASGPVILYHRASEAGDALPHFSVALSVTDTQITRHDPSDGPDLVGDLDRFERVWEAAKLSSPPREGRYGVVLRPRG